MAAFDLEHGDELWRQLHLSDDELASVRQEVGDVLIFLVRLCDKLEIDLEQAALEKLTVNENKYPIDLARGNAVTSKTFARRNAEKRMAGQRAKAIVGLSLLVVGFLLQFVGVLVR